MKLKKADPQVITLLPQVLDDGHLTDGQATPSTLKIRLSLPLPIQALALVVRMRKKWILWIGLPPTSCPEFLNRFNAVIEFKHLTKEDLLQIVDLMLAQVNQTLAKKDIHLDVSKEAKTCSWKWGMTRLWGPVLCAASHRRPNP